MSSLLLAQNELRGDDDRRRKIREHQELGQSSSKPSALVKAPTLIGWYQADGKAKANNRPPPDSDETGTSSPEKLTAGMIDRCEVAKTAATCVRVKVEIKLAEPGRSRTHRASVPSVSIARSPLTGTPNTKTASINRSTKLIIATAM